MDPIIGWSMTASVLIAGIMQIVKWANVPQRYWTWCTLGAAVLAIGLYVLTHYVPEAQFGVEAVVSLVAVLGIYIGSTGTYHAVKNVAMALDLTSGEKVTKP